MIKETVEKIKKLEASAAKKVESAKKQAKETKRDFILKNDRAFEELKTAQKDKAKNIIEKYEQKALLEISEIETTAQKSLDILDTLNKKKPALIKSILSSLLKDK